MRDLLLSMALAGALGASDQLPHYHNGKLAPYEIGPPSILLSKGDEEKLAEGEALMQAIVREDGISRRLLMVKDIKAPDDVITGRILDLDRYPQMVKGCDRTHTYEQHELANGRMCIKTTYEIHALHMRFKYFMVHEWDPNQRCMVFNLDYDRRSDLDDSVGYWYIQPTGDEQCRVYYSCDSKLRQWVPGPVYAILTKQALKQATTWVNDEAVKEWAKEKRRREADASTKGGLEGALGGFKAKLEGLRLPPGPELPGGMRKLFEGRGGKKPSKTVEDEDRYAVGDRVSRALDDGSYMESSRVVRSGGGAGKTRFLGGGFFSGRCRAASPMPAAQALDRQQPGEAPRVVLASWRRRRRPGLGKAASNALLG